VLLKDKLVVTAILAGNQELQLPPISGGEADVAGLVPGYGKRYDHAGPKIFVTCSEIITLKVMRAI